MATEHPPAVIFTALPSRPTNLAHRPRPTLLVPRWAINWRDVRAPARGPGLQRFMELLRRDGFPVDQPLRVSVTSAGATVIADDYHRRRAAGLCGIRNVPVRVVAGSPKDVHLFESRWWRPGQPEPSVLPELIAYEGRLYEPGGESARQHGTAEQQRKRPPQHRLFSRFPQAAVEAAMAPAFLVNTLAVLCWPTAPPSIWLTCCKSR